MKRKRRGYEFAITTRKSKDGDNYLFLRGYGGDVHAFIEVETKDALAKCGARQKKKNRWLNMREMAAEFLGF